MSSSRRCRGNERPLILGLEMKKASGVQKRLCFAAVHAMFICKQEPSGNVPMLRPHSVGAHGTGGPRRSVVKPQMIGMTSEGSFPASCADMVKLLLKALAVGLKVFKHKALRKHTCPSKAQATHSFRPTHARLTIWHLALVICPLLVQYLGV